YLAISLSPGLLSRLPKPGPWMETLRRLLSLPMFAAALWLVWVFARQTDFGATLWLGAACLVATAAALLLGRFAGRGRGLVVAGWSGVALSLGLAGVSAAVAPQKPDAAESLAADAWSPERVEAALAEGRPVLINF